MQGSLRLKVSWYVGPPTGNAYVQLATAAALNRFLNELPKSGPAKNMVQIDYTHWAGSEKAFVVRCKGTDRCFSLLLLLDETLAAQIIESCSLRDASSTQQQVQVSCHVCCCQSVAIRHVSEY